MQSDFTASYQREVEAANFGQRRDSSDAKNLQRRNLDSLIVSGVAGVQSITDQPTMID